MVFFDVKAARAAIEGKSDFDPPPRAIHAIRATRLPEGAVAKAERPAADGVTDCNSSTFSEPSEGDTAPINPVANSTRVLFYPSATGAPVDGVTDCNSNDFAGRSEGDTAANSTNSMNSTPPGADFAISRSWRVGNAVVREVTTHEDDAAREEQEAIIAFRDEPWRGDPEAEARYLEGLKRAAGGPPRTESVCGQQRRGASLAADFF